MPDRRGSRFVLEVLFLVALAVALTLASLRPIEIAGIMLAGWVIVAALEWAAWREQPHYGSGLPPRYYVPQVNLPPAHPLEQVAAGYPEARDEAPTWIASAALRAEMLGEWPVVSRPEPEVDEDEPAVDVDPWTRAEELPAAPLGELEPAAEPEAEPEPELAPEPVPVRLPAAPEANGGAGNGAALDVALARYRLDPLAEPEPRRRFGRGRGHEPSAVEVPARPVGVRALPGRITRQD
jgi:hypothetical protein